MQLGWGSELMQNETTFLILDGAMVLLAVTILTAFHPLFFFPFISKKDDKKPKAPAEEAGARVAGPEGEQQEMRDVSNTNKEGTV